MRQRRRGLSRGVEVPYQFTELVGGGDVPMGSHPFLDDLSHQRGRSDSPGVGGCFEFSLDVQIET